MDCPVCGKPYPCVHGRRNVSALPDHAACDEGSRLSASQERTANLPSASEVQRRADEEHWRREVASRVRQHRARRRRRSDLNASFEFDFPSDSALAIAPLLEIPQTQVMDLKEGDDSALLSARDALKGEALPLQPRNVLRFPRYAVHDPASFRDEDELDFAVPVPDSVRILDAPEPQQLELLPAFPDIRLDEDEDEDEDPELTALKGDMDLPPQPATLSRRAFSATVDLAVLLLAGGLLATIFFELAGGFPSSRSTLPYSLIVCGAFWCILQYVFLVYGGSTPGMSLAALELSTFAGQRTSVRARRTRAFAATLSALSLGLGFLWAFVDEDTLGWHDRISETYLKSSSQRLALSNQPDRHET